MAEMIDTEMIDALAPDGTMLICVPNVEHWSFLARLLRGDWDYQDTGLLDRAHLRWFTRTTMIELFESSGWQVVEGVSRNLNAPQQPQLLEAVRAAGFQDVRTIAAPGPAPAGEAFAVAARA